MPGPSRSLLLIAALGLATACSGDPEPEAVDIPTPSPTGPVVPVELACSDYPIEAAQQLITDPATGRTRVDGAVTRAVSVQNPLPGPESSTVHVIAFDVEGKSFVLVHPVTDGSGEATGDGPYAAVTGNTAAATGMPEDKQIEGLAAGDTVAYAVGCLSGAGTS